MLILHRGVMIGAAVRPAVSQKVVLWQILSGNYMVTALTFQSPPAGGLDLVLAGGRGRREYLCTGQLLARAEHKI